MIMNNRINQNMSDDEWEKIKKEHSDKYNDLEE